VNESIAELVDLVFLPGGLCTEEVGLCVSAVGSNGVHLGSSVGSRRELALGGVERVCELLEACLCL
jgi:hypothetical protein